MAHVEAAATVDGDRPLVTYALFAYNQERHVREAVAGALAQTYSPLQIILSDDCSRDRTFEIMREMAAEYRGPHAVTVRQSKRNGGVARHINDVIALCRSELIVPAAGDDISLPDRAACAVAAYRELGEPAFMFSDFVEMGPDGGTWNGRPGRQAEQEAGQFIDNPGIKGAAAIWTKRLFEGFAPLDDLLLNEDIVLPVRAYLLGEKPRMIGRKLIKYRRRTVRARTGQRYFWQFWPQFTAFRQMQRDVQSIGLADTALGVQIRRRFDRLASQVGFLASGSVGEMVQRLGTLRPFDPKEDVKLILAKLSCRTELERSLLDRIRSVGIRPG